MEQVSLTNFDVLTSEFKLLKFYFTKTFLSFIKVFLMITFFLWRLIQNLLYLLLAEPKLYRHISPTEKVVVNRSVNYNGQRIY